MKVLITGSSGFIGKNLAAKLKELGEYDVFCFNRSNTIQELAEMVSSSDAIVHLAGINRTIDESEYARGNVDLTATLCKLIELANRPIPVIFTSSSQARNLSNYGMSKAAAEEVLQDLCAKTSSPVLIYRLPNVFGKWGKPNYNSVVSTFCHNIANDLPITINDRVDKLTLVYIDDVVDTFVIALKNSSQGVKMQSVYPKYTCTVGELADQISAFKNCRTSLVMENVGSGLIRALYSTYVSYLPVKKFVYDLSYHRDSRGIFVEMLRLKDCGQFSFFTAHPGVTRGSHYHHTKTEKFLVLQGTARFNFRNILTNELYEVFTTGENPQVVETIPGWVHEITNCGKSEMIVMLWANEIFDDARPDTIGEKV